MSILQSELTKQVTLYAPEKEALVYGQNLESLLVSLRIQNQSWNPPIMAFWKALNLNVYKQELFPEIQPNKSDFKAMSGLRNGIEIVVDLEAFDAADEDGNGLGVIIENKDDYPLFDLKGFYLEPGKTALIKVQPTLYSATKRALDGFDYRDRKCVGDNEIKLKDGQTYGLSNCLYSAAQAKMSEKCFGLANRNNTEITGPELACIRSFMDQVGRWKIDKDSGRQCLPPCKRFVLM